MFGFSLDKNTPLSSAPFTQQAASYRKLRGLKYNENRQRISTCMFEGINTTGLPLFPNLTWIWFLLPEHHNLVNIDIDLVSSPRTSQSYQCSNSMPSPTTDVASNPWQSSQLAHPSYFNNPACRHFIPVRILTPSPLPQGVAGGVENHPLFRLSPPPLPPHINAHALLHTLHTFYLPLPLHLPHDPPYFCAIMNSLSIKNRYKFFGAGRLSAVELVLTT